MSGIFRHTFESAVADSGNPAKLRPSNWGSTFTDYDTSPTHDLHGGAQGSLIYRDTGSVDGGSYLPAAAGFLACVGAGQVPAYRALLAADIPSLDYVSSTTARAANRVLAGPTNGADAAPTFRALVAADVPDISATYVPTTRTVNGHALSANVSVTASDVGLGSVENAAASGLYVPLSRTINGYALSANVSLVKADVGLANVENTALSTWAGSSNLTTLGTIANLTATVINNTKVRGDVVLYTTIIGNDAGGLTSESNTAVGDRALHDNTTGQANTAIGTHVMDNNTTGNLNVAVGHDAMYNNISGNSNVAVGQYSLWTGTTSTNVVAVGRQALYTNTTNSHVAVGYQSAYSNTTGVNLVAVGSQALYTNSTGNSNTAVGLTSAYSNTTGSNHAVLGLEALYSNTEGSNNTVVGKGAAYNVTTGSSNTIIGYATGLGVTTGGKNTIIGANVAGLSSSLANTILLADGDGNVRLTMNTTTATFGTAMRAPSARLDDGFTVGGAADARYAIFVTPTFTSVGSTGAIARWGGTLTLPDNASGAHVRFQSGGITSAASGTHNLIVGAYFSPFTLTGGGATTANVATVYIEDAPAGTISGTRYAFWSAAGLNRFDGNGTHIFHLPANATDPTGGGGAAVGRIPVSIGGVTRYLAYY